jgi:long-chain acyl-CoA synthetase
MTMKSIEALTQELTASGTPFEMEVRTIRGVQTRCWKSYPATLPAVLQRSHTLYGPRDYLVFEDERFTYAETYARVGQLMQVLRADLGIRRGDRVAIAMRNYPEWVVAFWAITGSGAIAVPLNAWWQKEELSYALQDSGARVLFADEERMHLLGDLEESLPQLTGVAVRARDVLCAGWRSYDSLFTAVSAKDAIAFDESITPEDDATIFYTSGTTGKPKGALGTHRNICTNIANAGFIRARTTARQAALDEAAGTQRDKAVSNHSILLSVPLFHVTGSHSFLCNGTFAGNKLVMMRKWDAERALELIERERVSRWFGRSSKRPALQSVTCPACSAWLTAARLLRPSWSDRLPSTFPSQAHPMATD